MVVAQLAERSLPTLEVCGSTPGIGKLLFSSFPRYTIQKIDDSVDGVLGTQTRGGRIEVADEFTELWWHP